MKRLVVSIGLLLCAACESYSSIPQAAIPAGANVRLYLTDPGASAAAPYLGDGVSVIDGAVTHVDPANVALTVTNITRRSDLTELGEGRNVSIPIAGIASAQVRRLSAPRSLATAAAFVAGSILVARAIGGSGGSAASRGGGIPVQK